MICMPPPHPSNVAPSLTSWPPPFGRGGVRKLARDTPPVLIPICHLDIHAMISIDYTYLLKHTWGAVPCSLTSFIPSGVNDYYKPVPHNHGFGFTELKVY